MSESWVVLNRYLDYCYRSLMFLRKDNFLSAWCSHVGDGVMSNGIVWLRQVAQQLDPWPFEIQIQVAPHLSVGLPI